MTYIISDTHSASAVVVLLPDLWMTAQHGLRWTQELFDIVPVWTIEPDISVMKAITQPYLPLGTSYTVSPFAEGAFDKFFSFPLMEQITIYPASFYVSLFQ